MATREELLRRAFRRIEEWAAADTHAKPGASSEPASADSSVEAVGGTSEWPESSELSEEAREGLRRAYKRLDRLLVEYEPAITAKLQQSQEKPAEEQGGENIYSEEDAPDTDEIKAPIYTELPLDTASLGE